MQKNYQKFDFLKIFNIKDLIIISEICKNGITNRPRINLDSLGNRQITTISQDARY